MKRCHIRVSTRKTARTIKSPYTFGVIRDESPKATPGERLEVLDNKDVFYVFPVEASTIESDLKKLIRKHDLPDVVFHSLRHSSITYKLKLNGGDVKAVQGDSGHSQTSMVTDVYSHILDDDRRMNAQLFEEEFYSNRNFEGSEASDDTQDAEKQPSDLAALAKLLTNPETADLLKQLMTAMGK